MKRAVVVALALAGLSALIAAPVAALFSDPQTTSGSVSMACYPEPCGQAAVGGVAELPDIAQGPIGKTGSPPEGPDSSVRYYAVLVGGIVVAGFAASVGAWYARRRWLG